MQHVFIIGSRGLPAQYGWFRDLRGPIGLQSSIHRISSTMLLAFLMIKPIIILTTRV
ncbi:MAG: DUF1972 domain-containing protein [Streptococcus parasanguinis]